MSDISDKKAISILKELEKITGFDYDVAKKMYEEYRSKGYSRVKSAKSVWKKVIDDYFWVLYGAEGLDYKTTVDRFFDIISNITGLSYETIWKKYYAIKNNTNTSNVLKKTWNVYMNKYFNRLVKRR